MLHRQPLYAGRCVQSLVQLLEQVPAQAEVRLPMPLYRQAIGPLILSTVLHRERAFLPGTLEEMGVDTETLTKDVNAMLPPRGAERAETRTPGDSTGEIRRATEVGLEWWLWRTEEQAAALGHPYLGPEHLFLAVIAEADPALRELLNKYGITHGKLKDWMLSAIGRMAGQQETPVTAVVVHEEPAGARWDRPAVGVPRRFGLGVMLLLTFLYAALFAAMKLFDAHPLTFGLIAVLFTGVGLGQMLLFGGRYPRAASIWVGAALFPVEILVVCVIGDVYFRADIPFSAIFVFMMFGVPLGAGFGYLTGALSAGVFLLLEKVPVLHRRPPQAEPEGPWDEIG